MQLTILTDTSTALVALQNPQASSGSTWPWLAMAAISLLSALYTRNVRLLIVPLVFCALAVVSKVIPKPKHVYRMSVDYSLRQVHSEAFINEKLTKQQDVPFSDIASAEMQYNRDATRIALILRDGEQRFPLGEYHFNNEPDQYVILTRIRNAIGQTAPAGK